MSSEKRRRSRVEAGFDVLVEAGETCVTLTTINLSMKGILCTGNPRLTVDAECRITLELSPETTITAQGVIARADQEAVAIDFTGMDDESFAELHTLVQMNADDADRIAGELNKPYF